MSSTRRIGVERGGMDRLNSNGKYGKGHSDCPGYQQILKNALYAMTGR
ncbi:protein of unknown function [Azospirillum baldaniorum]|uniref:Uncharacterized protein n=1 Tax=Azospirillum baldaniorum TaxID=1064539 RepID=A0A9P1JMZ4_9PROT|nr:protein of unknown function [Azospirillum baldaniorum]